MLPEGDATEIGERGINLSGGQKARVSLARAMYCRRANVYLLDDPLSALDVHVANAVFDQCVEGLLRDKTTVLVLNSHYHFLPRADRIIVMDEGTIVGDGTYDQVKAHHAQLAGFDTYVDATSTSSPSSPHVAPPPSKDTTPSSSSSPTPGGGLTSKEDRSSGTVSLSTYRLYFGSSGYNGVVVMLSVLTFFTVSQAALSVTDWFMSYWSSHPTLNDSIRTGWYYLLCALVSICLVYGRSLYILLVALACSRSLHAKILHAVVHAPVTTFFDVTPVGRILNRFSADLDQLDSILPYFGLMLLQFFFQILAVLVVCMLSTPWILVVYVPLTYLFYKLQGFYNQSSSQLKRMDSIARSPVVSLVTESIQGLSTIRAFDKSGCFVTTQRRLVDDYMRVSFAYNCGGRWFQLRLDWVSSAILTGVAFVAVLTKSSIGLTAAGLSLTYASQLSFFLSKLAVFYTTVENTMTCVERLGHYETLDDNNQSANDIVQSEPAANWPTQGAITFQNYSMRYRDHLDLVLKDITLTVHGGEKIGICGRTGSGKSSLMAALFRMVPSATGSISIDGVDIQSMAITTLRARLTIIPQDPVLFSGSL
ncbi:hypothetical protein As57867_006048, partial [Aphanomyces stellatus]